jgi:tripartite ATP-independent transporter DctP family solute receptor
MTFVLFVLVWVPAIYAGGQQASSGTGSGSSAGDSIKTYTLKISTAAGATETHTRALGKFKEVLEASTDRAKVEIYDSATLFKQDANITAMIKGNLEMCYTDATWLAEFMPSLTMFTVPYLYKDYDHMNKVLNGDIGKEIFNKIAGEIGVRPLGAYYLGSRTINLREDKQVTKRSDLAGVQLRVANSESWLYMGRALGANPVAIGFNDTYLALQTGTVDGQENPLPGTMNAKFGEVTKSITLSNHVVGTIWLAIAENLWKNMDDEMKDRIMQAVKVSIDFCNTTNVQYEKDLVKEFRDKGLKVYAPDMSAYKEEVFGYYLNDKKMSGSWDMDLYKKIQSVK